MVKFKIGDKVKWPDGVLMVGDSVGEVTLLTASDMTVRWKLKGGVEFTKHGLTANEVVAAEPEPDPAKEEPKITLQAVPGRRCHANDRWGTIRAIECDGTRSYVRFDDGYVSWVQTAGLTLASDLVDVYPLDTPWRTGDKAIYGAKLVTVSGFSEGYVAVLPEGKDHVDWAAPTSLCEPPIHKLPGVEWKVGQAILVLIGNEIKSAKVKHVITYDADKSLSYIVETGGKLYSSTVTAEKSTLWTEVSYKFDIGQRVRAAGNNRSSGHIRDRYFKHSPVTPEYEVVWNDSSYPVPILHHETELEAWAEVKVPAPKFKVGDRVFSKSYGVDTVYKVVKVTPHPQFYSFHAYDLCSTDGVPTSACFYEANLEAAPEPKPEEQTYPVAAPPKFKKGDKVKWQLDPKTVYTITDCKPHPTDELQHRHRIFADLGDGSFKDDFTYEGMLSAAPEPKPEEPVKVPAPKFKVGDKVLGEYTGNTIYKVVAVTPNCDDAKLHEYRLIARLDDGNVQVATIYEAALSPATQPEEPKVQHPGHAMWGMIIDAQRMFRSGHGVEATHIALTPAMQHYIQEWLDENQKEKKVDLGASDTYLGMTLVLDAKSFELWHESKLVLGKAS